MKKICLLSLFLLIFFSFPTYVLAWRSALYPVDWEPGYKDSQGRFLHDFSYAGYMMGETEIPSMVGMNGIVNVAEAPYFADRSGQNDVTLILQKAIDDVGKSGGGIVYLPEGTYKVRPQGSSSYAISIPYSNIILRGAGKSKTFIRCYAENMRNKTIVDVGPPSGASWDRAEDGSTYFLAQDIGDMPTHTIYLQNVGNLKVGDWIIIRSDRSAEWVAEHGMNGFWSSSGSMGANMGTTFYRQITDVNAAEGKIKIDIPTRYFMKVRDRARVYKVTPKISNVGLEDFSIGNKMNPTTTGWGEEDYNSSSTNGAYQVHSAFLISYSYAVNSWAKNIVSYQAENASKIHMVSNGIDINRCRSLTFDRCEFSYPQYEGGGGNGYGFNICGQENLFTNCKSLSPRHAYSYKYAYASGNVMYNFHSGDGPKHGSDFHMYLSMSNLIDNQVLDGDYIESNVRPYGATSGNYHGITSSHTVFWNTNGVAYHGGYNYIIDSRQHKYGYVIGTKGAATNVKTTPLTMTSKYGSVDTSPVDFVEGVGLGSTLEPLSLYYDQLSKRLKRNSCVPILSSSNDGNSADNVLDNNLDTYWSTEGKGEYIEFCLGDEPVLFTGVKIAFYRGNSRKSTFDVWYSEDGNSWNVIQNGLVSSGSTNEKEDFMFSQAYLARKIRIIGQGNNLNTWSAFTEVELVTQQTSIEQVMDLRMNAFSIYPNPITNSKIQLKLHDRFVNENLSINITDLIGRKIYSSKVFTDSDDLRLEDLELPKGTYLLSLESSDVISTKIFLVRN